MSDDLPTSPPLYFAYGSNMSSARLRARVPAAQSLGRARLADVQLRFNKLGRDGSGKANLVGRPGAFGWGVVFALPPDALAVLDRFEPGYVRTQTHVELETGGSSSVQVYRAPAAVPEMLPHDWYVAHLIDGAREHRLPDALIAWLETRPTLGG